MKEKTPLEVLMRGVGLLVESDGETLFVGGDTYRLKETLKELGFTFRRGERAWMPVSWTIKDSEANRAAVRTQFPAASGWCWMRPVTEAAP